jgi:hypothetical protein
MTVSTPVHETTVTLRFFGSELDPDEVSQLLGSRPTLSRRKGDTLPGQPETERSSWLLPAESKSRRPLEEQIHALFDRLSDDLAVWRKLTDKYQGDIFCGVWMETWNGGFGLSPDLLRRIDERHLGLAFDVYYVTAER